jgi:hypothetical protein
MLWVDRKIEVETWTYAIEITYSEYNHSLWTQPELAKQEKQSIICLVVCSKMT